MHVSREGARRSESRSRFVTLLWTHTRVGREEASFEAERSFVRAPLNSRVVSSGGPRDKGKGKAKESSLYGVSIEIQEALVLEDLLFVLMVSSSPLRSRVSWLRSRGGCWIIYRLRTRPLKWHLVARTTLRLTDPRHTVLSACTSFFSVSALLVSNVNTVADQF